LPQRAIQHLRRNVIAYLALFLAVGAGGGYAIAAGKKSNTVHACVVKATGELLVKHRCGRGETKLIWNQQGPQGRTGATGPAGPAPPSAWAVVSGSGEANPSDGISVIHVSTGTYQITPTTTCSGKQNAPVVTVSNSQPPAGQENTAFPIAWVADSGAGQFMVFTGDVSMTKGFIPQDLTFNIQDVCGVP
jgi:hypothetical protein